LQNALAELLGLGVVPIVNENDSVSVRELEGAFGDNDELSALLARAVKADWLLLLTNVDGFLVPGADKKSRLVRVVRKLTPTLEAQCNGTSKLGRGGMISKLRAARLASEAGVHVAIVNGLSARLEPTSLRREEEGNGDERYKGGFHPGKTFAGASRFRKAGHAFLRREECAVACDRGRYRSKHPDYSGGKSGGLRKFGTRGRHARPAAADCGKNQRDGAGST
jgi:glutamate 5-kinase